LICPECSAEYREGFNRCAACDVELVIAVPDPGIADLELEPVTVFRASDPGLLSLVESLLLDWEIPYGIHGDKIQDLIAAGRSGGFNLAVGPAKVQVTMKDRETAQELLRPLLEPSTAQHFSDQKAREDVSEAGMDMP